MASDAPGLPAACPRSDVSAGAGLAGLAGLAGWLLACRQWPLLVAVLGLPGPRAPLSGPLAALAGLAATALPMVAWSLAVDRVHRDPATGIDWDHRRPLAASWRTSMVKLAGLWATWALIAAALCLCRTFWTEPFRFGIHVLAFVAVPLLPLSAAYVLWLDRMLAAPRDGAWHFGAALLGLAGADRAAIVGHARAWAVKGFFSVFMLGIVPEGFAALVRADRHSLADPVALSSWLCGAMFVIDVQVASVGYVLTLRPLGAQIRSAQPRLAGWIAALACYPPLMLMGPGGPLDYQPGASDWSAQLAGHPVLLWGWGLLLVALTGVYAGATVAFGPRFSNLTWRGTVTHGPYRWTKHPAYLAKNLFWWAASLPWWTASHSTADAVRNTAALAGVSAIYWWRARTEETHLLAEDGKYRAYAAWMAEHGPITSRLARCGRALAALSGQARSAAVAAQERGDRIPDVGGDARGRGAVDHP